MDFLTPHSYEELVSEIGKKSDEERREIIVDNYDIITGSYAQNFSNGIEMGSIVVLGGLQAAFDKLDVMPSEKYSIGKELFGDVVDNEDELEQVFHGYSGQMEESVCKMMSTVNNDEFQICILEYMISLAFFGGENKAGINNIKKIFESIFADMDIDDFEDWDEETAESEDCQEELAHMMQVLNKYDKAEFFAKVKDEDWAEDYESLSSEDDFTIESFAEELLEIYMEDGGLAITDFNGPYTPGNMEQFKAFFDKEIEDMIGK